VVHSQGAMLFGREGHILHTCFYQNDHSAIRPAYAPFPPGHVVVRAPLAYYSHPSPPPFGHTCACAVVRVVRVCAGACACAQFYGRRWWWTR
jgi:hypothetical protein